MEGLNYTAEQAMQLLKIPEAEWQKYIAFICALLKESNKCFYAYLSGSALDSYIVYKYAKAEKLEIGHIYHMFRNGARDIGNRLLKSEKAKEILFNDALRFNIEVVGLRLVLSEWMTEYNGILESVINESGLYRKKRLKGNSSQLLILSNDEITERELDIIEAETGASSPEETEMLRKPLIICISVKHGL